MSIEITTAQAATLTKLAAEQDRPLCLHQVGGDRDVLVSTAPSGEPEVSIDPDEAEKRIGAGGRR
jgi:hypothetical protein